MPLKVLVVEDEAVIAFLLEDAVEAAGHAVVHVAANIQDAMTVAMHGQFDVALLDVNLNGQKAHAVPVVLQSRGKPFGFVTGYGSAGVLEMFADAPLLAKPFDQKQIGRMLDVLATKVQA